MPNNNNEDDMSRYWETGSGDIKFGLWPILKEFLEAHSWSHAVSTVCQAVSEYEQFAEVWKKCHMSYVMCGRSKPQELREIADVSLNASLHYCQESQKVETRAFGLYLLYAFYETQSVNPKSKIRVNATLFQSLCNFIDENAKKEHYDLAYVFTRLRMSRAFCYAATHHERTIVRKTPKNNDKEVKPNDGKPPKVVTSLEDISLEILEDLGAVHEEYQRIKITVAHQTQEKPVNLIRGEFVRDLTKKLANFDEWRKTGKRLRRRKRRDSKTGAETSETSCHSDSDSAAEEKQQPTVQEKRASIRQKAFGTVGEVSRSRRHRQLLTAEASQSDTQLISSPNKRKKKDSTKKITEVRTVNRTVLDDEAIARTNAYLSVITARKGKDRKIIPATVTADALSD